MNYQMLLLAHDAYYCFETKAKHYDTCMANKKPELWINRDLPDVEVKNLFIFLRRWQPHFTGKEYLFKTAYNENYDEIQFLNGKRFKDIDLDDKNNQISIQNIFNAFSRINENRKYESTAASKLAHVMDPDLFIMWDQYIREGHLGSPLKKYARDYVFDFLPLMRKELNELLESCTRNSGYSKTEAYDLLEKITGNSVPKLIDQYNYMNYTKPTEYETYLGNVSENEKETMSLPFKDSIGFWKEKVTTRTHRDRKRTRQFVQVLNELRSRNMITAKERRDYNEKWKKFTDDRDYWFSYVTQLLENA